MNQTDATFPKYSVVMTMNGVGPSLGSQIMAEIGTLPVSPTGKRLPLSQVSLPVKMIQETEPEKCAFFKEMLF